VARVAVVAARAVATDGAINNQEDPLELRSRSSDLSCLLSTRLAWHASQAPGFRSDTTARAQPHV
jgi:hypothetical protein